MCVVQYQLFEFNIDYQNYSVLSSCWSGSRSCKTRLNKGKDEKTRGRYCKFLAVFFYAFLLSFVTSRLVQKLWNCQSFVLMQAIQWEIRAFEEIIVHDAFQHVGLQHVGWPISGQFVRNCFAKGMTMFCSTLRLRNLFGALLLVCVVLVLACPWWLVVFEYQIKTH